MLLMAGSVIALGTLVSCKCSDSAKTCTPCPNKTKSENVCTKSATQCKTMDKCKMQQAQQITTQIPLGTTYELKLSSFKSDSKITDKPEQPITITFEKSENAIKAVGFAGVNRYFSKVLLDEANGFLVFGPIGATRAMGKAMQYETEFLNELKDVKKFHVVGDELSLIDDSGDIIGVFVKEKACPVKDDKAVESAPITPVAPVVPADKIDACPLTKDSNANLDVCPAPKDTALKFPIPRNVEYVLNLHTFEEGDDIKEKPVNPITITLIDLDEGGVQVAGCAGVNRYFGKVVLDENAGTIQFGLLGSTMMAGPGMSYEQEFLKELKESAKYKVSDSALVLYEDDGDVVGVFEVIKK